MEVEKEVEMEVEMEVEVEVVENEMRGSRRGMLLHTERGARRHDLEESSAHQIRRPLPTQGGSNVRLVRACT